MSRGRSKDALRITSPVASISKKPAKHSRSEEENCLKDFDVKSEAMDESILPASSKQSHDSENKLTCSPDLNQYKFQNKTHVKIEFEKESPENKEKGLWEPPNWQEFLVNLKNMRSNNDAPVDTMGCHMAMDEHASPEVMRYQSLIALMLSSQTKDQVTFAAMERLRIKGLTVDGVLNMSDEELGKLIYPVGFWKTKVKYIKKTTQTLKELYNGDIPNSVDKLCKLTGVGPKMAHICMKVAWNKVTGIGVDTHVHRISNRIGWVKKPTATPEDTRKALQSWLPSDLWSDVNHLMVGFGQTICTPISPKCDECLNNDICPSSSKGRKTQTKKKTPTESKTLMEGKIPSEGKTFTKGKTPTKRKNPTKGKKNMKTPVKKEIEPEGLEIHTIDILKSLSDKLSSTQNLTRYKEESANMDEESVNQRISKNTKNKRNIDEDLSSDDSFIIKKSPFKNKSPPKLFGTSCVIKNNKSPQNKRKVDEDSNSDDSFIIKKSPLKKQAPRKKESTTEAVNSDALKNKRKRAVKK